VQSFELRHLYPWSSETVWQALDSPEYTELRIEHGRRQDAKVSQELLSDGDEDGIRVRRVRHTLHRSLPRMIQRITGPTLSYLVREQIQPDRFSVEWSAVPEVQRAEGAVDRRVRIEGSYHFVDVPGETPSCERIVKARITVAIPGFSGRIEKGIAKSLRATHESSAKLAQRFLDARLRPQGSPE
jgi:hypothetical protein